MVLKILLGAVFGALFGYVLGWLIELFPWFNNALLDGLRVIFGIHDVRMVALLAAVGFIGGIVSGLIGTLAHEMKHDRWYWHWDWI